MAKPDKTQLSKFKNQFRRFQFHLVFVFFSDVNIEKSSGSETLVALLALEGEVALDGVTQLEVTPKLRHRPPVFGVASNVVVGRVEAVRMGAKVTTVFPK